MANKKVAAAEVFSNLTGVACSVWSKFAANPESKLLLASMGYVNYAAGPDGSRCPPPKVSFSHKSS